MISSSGTYRSGEELARPGWLPPDEPGVFTGPGSKRVRQAHQSDTAQIVQWRQEASEWLATIGSDQWNSNGLTQETFRRRVETSIAAGETWILETEDGSPLGTFAADQHTDAGLWTDEELRHSLILHRMIVPRGHSGRGIGKAMVQQAEQIAAEHGLSWLAIDVWTTATRLQQHYLRQGWEHVRTVQDHGTPSGALFRRPVRYTTAQTREAANDAAR